MRTGVRDEQRTERPSRRERVERHGRVLDLCFQASYALVEILQQRRHGSGERRSAVFDREDRGTGIACRAVVTAGTCADMVHVTSTGDDKDIDTEVAAANRAAVQERKRA